MPSSEKVCQTHPKRKATGRCEECQNLFCDDCLEVIWHQAFIRQFLGQKKHYERRVLCSTCNKKLNRTRLVAYISILFIILLPVIYYLIQGFRF